MQDSTSGRDTRASRACVVCVRCTGGVRCYSPVSVTSGLWRPLALSASPRLAPASSQPDKRPRWRSSRSHRMSSEAPGGVREGFFDQTLDDDDDFSDDEYTGSAMDA